MSQCAVAAYHTAPKDFVLDSLQAYFLAGPSSKKPILFKVTRISNGKRFAVRNIIIEQDGRIMLTATTQFVNGSPWNGPAMTYSKSRQTTNVISNITLDDLDSGRHNLGPTPFMRFQRLPLLYKGCVCASVIIHTDAQVCRCFQCS